MTPKPAIKQNIKLYAILLVLLLSLSTFFSYRFQNDFKPEDILNDLEYKIASKDKELIQELKFLEQLYQQNPDFIFEKINRYKNEYEENGFYFLVFEKNKLVFWSDNKSSTSIKTIQDTSEIINTGNGWFRKLVVKNGTTRFAGFYLIKKKYSYQNQYLENNYHESLGLDESIIFSINPKEEFYVNNQAGKFLFGLIFTNQSKLSNQEVNILFVLYLATLLILIAFLYELHLSIYLKTKKYILFLFGFIADLLLLRIAIFYFEVPRVLQQSDLFSPFYYGFSDLIPSIADLFLDVLFLLIIAFFIFYYLKFKKKNLRKHPFHQCFVVFTLFIHIFIFFKGIDFAFKSLIFDSSISLDLNNIFSLSLMSFFNILIISAFILAYILITSKLSFFAFQYCLNFRKYSLWAFISFAFFTTYCAIFGNCDYWQLLFVFAYIISFGFFFQRKEIHFNLGNIIFYILLFSIISTYSLHKYNTLKEQEYRKLLAVHLASEQRDPLAEFLFQKESDKIYNDTTVINYLNQYGLSEFDYDSFYKYFTSEFLTGYWKKYNCQITICTSDDMLILQPDDFDVNCISYFENKIETDGLSTESPELFFLKYSPGENGYIAILDFSASQVELSTMKLFIELYPKYVARDLGFPDLLVDKEIDKSPDLSSYSYAKYQDGELYKRVGEYFYNVNISHYQQHDAPFVFFNQNNYKHLLYSINTEKSLIISAKRKTILDTLAPFSYLFLFFIIFFGVLYLLFILPFSHKNSSLSFRTRLQVSISSLILFSFIVIGIFTLVYINKLNEQKNKDLLSEKTHSVLVEMQHKFSGTTNFDDNISLQLSELLVKFSSVFFTDINLYDLNGELISSSRPQIYDELLISRKLNSEAYKALSIDNISLFIHDENIGKQEYLSAYIPFVNSMGDVIAYLNLPYFAKENDLNKEISTFLVAYINIYVILIAISLLIAIIISNYISQPIKMIMTKIRLVKLGGQNETIQWNRKDEIGQLVEEYNLMIEELAQSAELLSKSERESAWREMAKQIAHEIKNPLTPMKLSVQYLQRAWQNESPDYEKRLNKFTQTMVEQIDTLSNIATEFSDFAKMPITKKEFIDLVEIIKSSISLYKNYAKVTFTFEIPTTEKFMINADKEQLLRAFSNLLKNSIQAIGNREDGKITIRIYKHFKNNVIELSDNGGGIPDEIAGKIFSPNFTTKSGGMGLGLAIVKNIVHNSGGTINYTSEKGKETTFTLKFPIPTNQ